MNLDRYTIPGQPGVFMAKLKSICGACSKEFFYNQWDHKNGKFCSIVCFHGSRNKPLEKSCFYCDKYFIHYESDGRKDPTCSFSCGQKQRRSKIRDEWNIKSESEKLLELKRRFDKLVIKQEGCWGWNAAKVHGYGTLKFSGKSLKAHRISWMIYNGPIPENMLVLHKCIKSRQCSNPEHLYLGSYLQNYQDSVKDGHTKRPVTKEDVVEIRKLIDLGVPITKLSPRFHISISSLSDIKNRKTWKHI